MPARADSCLRWGGTRDTEKRAAERRGSEHRGKGAAPRCRRRTLGRSDTGRVAREPPALIAGSTGRVAWAIMDAVPIRFLSRITGAIVLGTMMGLFLAGAVGLVVGSIGAVVVRAIAGADRSIDAFVKTFVVLGAAASFGLTTGWATYALFLASPPLTTPIART